MRATASPTSSYPKSPVDPLTKTSAPAADREERHVAKSIHRDQLGAGAPISTRTAVASCGLDRRAVLAWCRWCSDESVEIDGDGKDPRSFPASQDFRTRPLLGRSRCPTWSPQKLPRSMTRVKGDFTGCDIAARPPPARTAFASSIQSPREGPTGPDSRARHVGVEEEVD